MSLPSSRPVRLTGLPKVGDSTQFTPLQSVLMPSENVGRTVVVMPETKSNSSRLVKLQNGVAAMAVTGPPVEGVCSVGNVLPALNRWLLPAACPSQMLPSMASMASAAVPLRPKVARLIWLFKLPLRS